MYQVSNKFLKTNHLGNKCLKENEKKKKKKIRTDYIAEKSLFLCTVQHIADFVSYFFTLNYF